MTCTTSRKWHDNSEKCTHVFDRPDSCEHWAIDVLYAAARTPCTHPGDYWYPGLLDFVGTVRCTGGC